MSKTTFFHVKQLRDYILHFYREWDAAHRNVFEVYEPPFAFEDAYFAGGCIRDIFRGREPKDYDFVIPSLHEANEQNVFSFGEQFLTYLYQELQIRGHAPTLVVYHAYGKGCDEEEIDAGSDFNERIFMAATITDIAGRDVDFLFSRYGCVTDAVETFDTTMNQVWLDENGMVRDTHNWAISGREFATKAHYFTKPVRESRRERMLERAKQLCLKHSEQRA